MRRLCTTIVALTVVAGCTSARPHVASQHANPPAPSNTVWLCRPDRTPNPCTSDLTATVVHADGSRAIERPPSVARSSLDCFYVYPTVSRENGPNADLQIQPAERNTAVAQASRFSSACDVWAPIYRQRTISDLFNLADGAPNSAANRTAFASVESAWRDYLAHHNHGRRVVLIGHSQGAAMLIRLLRADIDGDAHVRAKVALARLLGGNVTVADGSLIGGSFRHIPLCSRRGESGCVIAYSSFPTTPPAFALFGRAGAGVSLLSGETASDRQVACVNPATFDATSAPLATYFPTGTNAGLRADTPWVSTPGRFVAQCRHAGTATWLQVTPAPHDGRPKLTEPLGPAWGYHVADLNLALGNLVDDVAALAAHR